MKIFIAGGGTGGHIYPALAIADAIKKMQPTATVEFVGTPRGLENRLVPRAGYQLHLLPVGRLNRNVGWVERLTTLLTLPFVLIQAIQLLHKLKPDVVLGVGGYASGPIVLMAALFRKKVLIWEPNAYPGMANRWLAPFVDECLVVFNEAKKYLKNKKITQAAMPVRAEIEVLFEKNKNQQTNESVKRENEFHILVFGGSQGARPINNALTEAILSGGEWLKGIHVVQQTGAVDYKRIQTLYSHSAESNQYVELHEYLYDMPDRYQKADLVIARAGTGTISEIAACGKPAILIPLPSAADDHQSQNAIALVARGGARLLPQKELTPERLITEILYLKKHFTERQIMAQRIREFHTPQAAEKIAQTLLATGSLTNA